MLLVLLHVYRSINPLPYMAILGSTSSAANKWGYNYLIGKKTLWEKEKLLVTSNFYFSHKVFKSCLLLICQNEYLWSKGLKPKAYKLFENNDADLSWLFFFFKEANLFSSG